MRASSSCTSSTRVWFARTFSGFSGGSPAAAPSATADLSVESVTSPMGSAGSSTSSGKSCFMNAARCALVAGSRCLVSQPSMAF